MYTITILKPNRELYWRESFSEKPSATKWLTVEKSRPYWDKGFIVEIDDKLAEAKLEREKFEADAKAALEAREQLRVDIKQLVESKPKTIEECFALIEKLVEFVGIK
jgi:hypothetical protein